MINYGIKFLENRFRWAYTAEQVLHGTPSGGKLIFKEEKLLTLTCAGIDNSVATHGGVVAYRAGVMQPLQVHQALLFSFGWFVLFFNDY